VLTSIKRALAFRIPENLCKLRKTRLNETPISPQRRAQNDYCPANPRRCDTYRHHWRVGCYSLWRGWFGTRASDLTAALVGIAGAFLGFHVGVAAGLTPVPVADYLVAIVGALVTLWAWRNR